jgi:hypothetical protein
MKRTNVVLDEELLEKARRMSGERTYSATVTKALEAVVKRGELEAAIARVRVGGDPFAPGYVEAMWPDLSRPKKHRISADERRVPRKKSVARGAR